MKKILILCEGVTDQVFIADCLEKFYDINIERKEKIKPKKDTTQKDEVIIEMKLLSDVFDIQIIATEGCKKLNTDRFINLMKDNIDEKGENIVIFDADDETIGNGNNGFKNAQTSLNSIKQQADFDYYLWPNNSDNGDVEILLRQLIPTDKEPVIRCIEQHQDCLKKTGIKGLRLADNKAQLTFYLYTNSVRQTEGRHRDYTDTAFWNLDPKQNEALQKLKTFLDKYFI